MRLPTNYQRMIKRLHSYIYTFRNQRGRTRFVRPNRRKAERVIRGVITRHKEALKELSDR